LLVLLCLGLISCGTVSLSDFYGSEIDSVNEETDSVNEEIEGFSYCVGLDTYNSDIVDVIYDVGADNTCSIDEYSAYEVHIKNTYLPNLPVPRLNYRFIPSPELQLIAEHVEQYLGLVCEYGKTMLYHAYGVENLSYGEFLVVAEQIPFAYQSHLLFIDGVMRMTEEIYYHRLGGLHSTMYQLKYANMSNSEYNEIVLTILVGNFMHDTLVLRWCDAANGYRAWFGLRGVFEVIRIDGKYMLVSTIRALQGEPFFDIMVLEGNEARGIRVSHSDIHFEDGFFYPCSELNRYGIPHPSTFFPSRRYDLLFSLYSE